MFAVNLNILFFANILNKEKVDSSGFAKQLFVGGNGLRPHLYVETCGDACLNTRE